jgi:hypothetical protein
MPDVNIKLNFLYQFSYKILHSISKTKEETCLKNPLFCNFAFFGIKKSEGYPKKLNNDSLFLLKIKNNL